MSKPRFSIITVSLNVQDSIEATILSVLNQSYRNFEYIIIDGKSTDKTFEIIQKYKKELAFIVSESDSGIYSAMNKGASLAKGDYLYFLNAGDVLENNKILEEVADEIDKNDADLLYGKTRVMNSNNEGGYVKGKFLNKFLLRLGCKIGQQSVFVKRNVFNEVDGLNEKYKIAADFDLLCKILGTDHYIGKIDRVICNYDNKGVSSDFKKSYKDTAGVIKDRYGIFWFSVYSIFSTLKLIVAKVYFTLKGR